jgi:hypothetical protein
VDIDAHHAGTYVVARLAGMPHQQAEVVAYCAQYVDDATNEGVIRFQNGALYRRICSAHKMLDYRNTEALASARVCVPFHFLPGNEGQPAGQDPPGSFVDKLICRPDSAVAQEMVRDAILAQSSPYSLHRLGITAHVYADTWTHQGFTGTNDVVNKAKDLVGPSGEPDLTMMERLKGFFVSSTFPLGHGAVLGHPDRPYLIWGYTNGRGQKIARNNPADFMAAFDAMYRMFRRYLLSNPHASVPGIPDPDRTLILSLFRTLTDPDGYVRHQQWLDALAQGHFSFGKVELSYLPKGVGSWKHTALGTEKETDDEDEIFQYSPAFLKSDWKLFHDALQAHRFHVVHELLPRYGICTA